MRHERPKLRVPPPPPARSPWRRSARPPALEIFYIAGAIVAAVMLLWLGLAH